jgi:hypothetical protein
MEKLSAELKAELVAKRQAAEINAKIRAAKNPQPRLNAPAGKAIKVLPEIKEDPYKRANPVSEWYYTFEDENFSRENTDAEPKFRPRKHNPDSRKEFDLKVKALVNKYSTR